MPEIQPIDKSIPLSYPNRADRGKYMSRLYRVSASLERRYWKKVNKAGPHSCWNWTAAKSSGYGVIGIRGRRGGTARATHVAWLLSTKKRIPNGGFVCHLCDNPSCVNPAHLFLGNSALNHQDMVRKGRHIFPPLKRGQDNGNSKLSLREVKRIRQLCTIDGITYKEIGKIFAISKTNVLDIAKNKIWRHVK